MGNQNGSTRAAIFFFFSVLYFFFYLIKFFAKGKGHSDTVSWNEWIMEMKANWLRRRQLDNNNSTI